MAPTEPTPNPWHGRDLARRDAITAARTDARLKARARREAERRRKRAKAKRLAANPRRSLLDRLRHRRTT